LEDEMDGKEWEAYHEVHEAELLRAARRIRKIVNATRPKAMNVDVSGVFGGLAFVRGARFVKGAKDSLSNAFVLNTDDHEWMIESLEGENPRGSGLREPNANDPDFPEEGASVEDVAAWILEVTA
jgi:hypothetical protein